MMSREDHLQFCKERALALTEPGPHFNLLDAVTSMASDMEKHPETKMGEALALLMMVGCMDAQKGDVAAVRRWIEGFN